MKTILLILLLILSLRISSAQRPSGDYVNMSYAKEFIFFPGNDSITPFYMSYKPVTNREYLIYLLWLSSVYEDQPEVLFDAIPGLIPERTETNEIPDINTLAGNTNKNVCNYLFNARYIDYPVMGLSWKQSSAFCRWLSDRYNEYILLKRKELEYFAQQSDDNCFTTETWLNEQYYGIIGEPSVIENESGEERLVMWNDKILFPTFRLPSSYEICFGQEKADATIGPYRMFRFLELWHRNVSFNDTLVLSLFENEVAMDHPVKLIEKPVFDLPESAMEWSLNPFEICQVISITKIYEAIGQDVIDYDLARRGSKDHTGHMPYMIIGETPEGYPLAVENQQYNRKDSSMTEERNNIFRVAVSALKSPGK